MCEPVYKFPVFFFLHFSFVSEHILWETFFTSDSEAECLLRILKIVMRGNSSESLCALAYFIILSAGRGSAGFYLCNPQKKKKKTKTL